jgi:hypothetical protein
MAMTDLNKSTYSGEFGFLIVEPAAGDPGSYDREVLLAARSASRASALDRGGRLREGPERSEAPRRGDCDPGATAGALASNSLPWWEKRVAMGTFYGNRATRDGRHSPGADRALARRSMHGTLHHRLGA